MADQWASTDDHAPAAAPAAGGWASTDDHSPTAQPQQQPQGSALSRLGSAFWEGIGGKALVDMLGGASRDPVLAKKSIDTAKGIVQSLINEPARVWSELGQSGSAMVKGDVTGALSHMGGAVPLVGAPALQVQHNFENGDYAAGFGHAMGMLLPFASGALNTSVKTPALGVANSTEADAMSYLRSKGVPTNAGAETGNNYVQGVQKLADSSPIGAVVNQNAQRATTSALRSTAAGLLKDATPPVSAETHYTAFRQAEANPRNIRTVPTGELDAAGNPVTEDMPLPVKVSELKPILKPIYAEMQWMPMADRNASAGYQAIKKIIEGPDFIPASQAEIGLGGIKKMAREGDGRNAGIAKFITPKLQDLIDDTVSSVGGPKAINALEKGRAAAASEAGADWLTDAFKKAEAEGGFHREAGIWADWTRLRDEAKRTMFTPAQVSDLNNFFLGAKKLAENPNPSGSGIVAHIGGQLYLAGSHPALGVPMIIGSGALSKLLHSPTGIKLLTDGLTVPVGTPRAAAIAGQISSIIGSNQTDQQRPALSSFEK